MILVMGDLGLFLIFLVGLGFVLVGFFVVVKFKDVFKVVFSYKVLKMV